LRKSIPSDQLIVLIVLSGSMKKKEYLLNYAATESISESQAYKAARCDALL